MPSQAVIEFLSSPDIINVVNNVVVSPDLHYTVSAGNSFWNGFPTFACLALQVLLLLKQCQLSQEINLNTEFENENHFVRGELSNTLFYGEALCQQIRKEFSLNQLTPAKIDDWLIGETNKIYNRISLLSKKTNQEFDADVNNVLKELKKHLGFFKNYCTQMRPETNQDMFDQDMLKMLETLSAYISELQKTIENKKYVLKKKPL